MQKRHLLHVLGFRAICTFWLLSEVWHMALLDIICFKEKQVPRQRHHLDEWTMKQAFRMQSAPAAPRRALLKYFIRILLKVYGGSSEEAKPSKQKVQSL